MVLGIKPLVPFVVLAVLEEGEVGDPQQLVDPFGDDIHPPGHFAPEHTQCIEGGLPVCVGHDEHQVPLPCPGLFQQSLHGLRLEELGKGRTQLTLFVDLGPGQALYPIGLDELSQAVDLLAAEFWRRLRS